MKPLTIIQGAIVLLITLPIWFYLVYRILGLVDATELMWFLYWVYVPFSLIAHFIGKIIEVAERSKP